MLTYFLIVVCSYFLEQSFSYSATDVGKFTKIDQSKLNKAPWEQIFFEMAYFDGFFFYLAYWSTELLWKFETGRGVRLIKIVMINEHHMTEHLKFYNLFGNILSFFFYLQVMRLYMYTDILFHITSIHKNIPNIFRFT